MARVTRKALLQKARDALTTDATLLAWVRTTFSRRLKVYVGIDAALPPGEDDCPFVALFADPAERGEEVGEHTLRFAVSWGCLVPEKSTTEPAGGAELVEYQGLYRIDEFWEQIWAALATAFLATNVALSSTEEDQDTVEAHPLYVGVTTVTAVVPQLLGAEVSL